MPEAPAFDDGPYQAIVKTLNPDFWKEENSFNPTEFVLASLPENLDDKWFDEQLTDKEKALDIINSKLFQKVMENYESFGTSYLYSEVFGSLSFNPT